MSRSKRATATRRVLPRTRTGSFVRVVCFPLRSLRSPLRPQRLGAQTLGKPQRDTEDSAEDAEESQRSPGPTVDFQSCPNARGCEAVRLRKGEFCHVKEIFNRKAWHPPHFGGSERT